MLNVKLGWFVILSNLTFICVYCNSLFLRYGPSAFLFATVESHVAENLKQFAKLFYFESNESNQSKESNESIIHLEITSDKNKENMSFCSTIAL